MARPKIDKAMSFFWDGKKINITGKHSVMRVNKTDAYRLAIVCLAADSRFELLPSDWRHYFTRKTETTK
jgi:hypothetical protein